MSSEPAAAPSRGRRALVAGSTARISALRRRWAWFDHLARAGGRYQRTQGDLMAAGVTYFVFLGLFPVLLLVASVIGLVLAGDALLQAELFAAIRDAVPGRAGEELVAPAAGGDRRGRLRRTRRPGRFPLRRAAGHGQAADRDGADLEGPRRRAASSLRDNLQDLLALVALGAAGLASLGLTGAVTQATSWVLDAARAGRRAAGFGRAHLGGRHRAGLGRRHRRLPLAAAGGALGQSTRCACCCPVRSSARPASRCSS